MLSRLQGFASEYAADFYRWPRNENTITLVKQPWSVPASYPYGGADLVPLRAMETVAWQVRPDA